MVIEANTQSLTFQLRTVELITLGISSEAVSSMVAMVMGLYCLSKKNRNFGRQGIFSFFRLKLKKERFFFVFFPALSNSEAKEPESEAAECDSSSTVGGRRECEEALGTNSSPDMGLEATEAEEEETLFGKGGLAARLLLLVCSSVSDTDVVMFGTSDMFVVDGDALAATAEAATEPMLDAASWLYDLTIMRPLGPTLGVIFLEAGKGGVPVTLPGPDDP